MRWMDKVAVAHRLEPTTVRPASADASFRRYLRVDAGKDTFIIMDAPPDKENCEPFMRVAGLMAEAGLRVPRVLDWDAAWGFMLLEDLGSQTMIEALEPSVAEANQGLYLQAVDALLAWQLASRPGVLPPYDAPLLARELSLFPEWYLSQYRGVQIDAGMRETLDRTFELIVQHNLASPSVYVHRDFMPRNLMPTTDDSGPAVLDFQDAVRGPIAYDALSLFKDAFLSWPEARVDGWLAQYHARANEAGLPVPRAERFRRDADLIGIQRHLKVLGIFARLHHRDHKPKYLEDAPRFVAYLRDIVSRYPELAPLQRVLERRLYPVVAAGA